MCKKGSVWSYLDFKIGAGLSRFVFKPLNCVQGLWISAIWALRLVLGLIYSKDFEIRLLGYNKRIGPLKNSQSLDVNHLGFEIRTNPFN